MAGGIEGGEVEVGVCGVDVGAGFVGAGGGTVVDGFDDFGFDGGDLWLCVV